MNNAVPYYCYLGNMKAEMEMKVSELQEDYDIWLETQKNKHDDENYKND